MSLLVSAIGVLLLLIGGWMIYLQAANNRAEWPVMWAWLAVMLLMVGGVLAWSGYHPDADWAAIWGAMKGT